MRIIKIEFKKKYLIYELNKDWAFTPNLDEGVFFQEFDKHLINEFFSQDRFRKKIFSKFIQNNHIGYLLHDNVNWINYTWVSPPYQDISFHLPKKIKGDDKYWIFFCRTNSEYQNRGFYSLSLKYLCNKLIEKHFLRIDQIYIDTESDLIPARKAIEKAGFNFIKPVFLTSIRIPSLINIRFLNDYQV